MQPLRSLRTVLDMIKFEHTIFALPFAFLGTILAAEGWPRWVTLTWIIVAMVGARSAAMSFNRLVDRGIDGENPRTAARALPAGAVSPGFVSIFVLLSLGLFFVAAWQLNELTMKLSLVATPVLLGYSYTKRFTALSHLVLGLALAGAPLGAWVAVRGSIDAPPLVLAGVVVLWVAGFDVLYALQDMEFDRGRGLHSIPAALGEAASLWISGAFHLGMVALLVLLSAVYEPGLGTAYWIGVAGCAALLAYQHWVVRPGDLSRLNAAFFLANGLLATWLFAATAVDLLVLR